MPDDVRVDARDFDAASDERGDIGRTGALVRQRIDNRAIAGENQEKAMAVYLVGEDVRDDGFKSDAAVREVSACELFGRDAQRRRDRAMPQNLEGRAVGGNGVEFAGVKPALDAHPVAGGDFAVGLRRVVPAGHAEAAVLHGEGQLVLRPQADDGCRDVERPPEIPSDLGRAQFGDCRQGWLRIACRRPRGQENEGNGEKRHRANYTKTPRRGTWALRACTHLNSDGLSDAEAFATLLA